MWEKVLTQAHQVLAFNGTLGEPGIIRIMATLHDRLPEGVSYPGVVLLEELNVKVADFVLQRLPDLAEKKPRRTKRPTTIATRKTDANNTEKGRS